MRLSILPLLLTGASLVSLVAAEPIRVIEHPSNANIRFGHALANANVNGNDDNVARVVRPVVLMNPAPPEKVTGFSRHFCGASLREKALHFSNAIRHALGMPLIEVHRVAPRPGELHILPMPYPLQSNVILHPQDESDKPRKYYGHERPNHPGGDGDHEHTPHDGHHGHHGHHHRHHKSFLKRIHKAIKALGPWEGRAVSFVLGCGIGVLLRMFWVLSVLTYRTVRGERGETLELAPEPGYIVYEQVPETLFVAPPQYVDEKVKVEVHEEIEERK